jgi:CheY-like chemotaxis protein
MHSILVVDDDPQIRQLMIDVLNRDGYLIAWAANGQDALDKITLHSVDIVVTDLSMPVKDGFALIDDLRRDYPQIPIIVVSGEEVAHDSHGRASSIRADSVIAKPFSPYHLLKVVETLLTARKAV